LSVRVNSRKNIRESSGRELTRNGHVVATFLDDQRLSFLGNLIQSVLAKEDLVEQRCHVQRCTGGPEVFLRLCCNILPCQHPCAWCLCCVVHLGDVAPGPFLVEELLAGKEPVRHEVQREVQSVTVSVQPKSATACPPPRPTRSTGGRRGGPAEGPCTSERGSCHPEECSGYGRARAGGTSVSLLPGAFPSRPDSSGGEAAASRPPDGDAHVPFWSSTKSGMPPARRTGPRNVLAFQMVISAFCTAGPTRGGRCRYRRFVGSATSTSSPRKYRCPACCRTRAACLLQYPAPSQKSSNTSDFLVFPAFRYACA